MPMPGYGVRAFGPFENRGVTGARYDDRVHYVLVVRSAAVVGTPGLQLRERVSDHLVVARSVAAGIAPIRSVEEEVVAGSRVRVLRSELHVVAAQVGIAAATGTRARSFSAAGGTAARRRRQQLRRAAG